MTSKPKIHSRKIALLSQNTPAPIDHWPSESFVSKHSWTHWPKTLTLLVLLIHSLTTIYNCDLRKLTDTYLQYKSPTKWYKPTKSFGLIPPNTWGTHLLRTLTHPLPPPVMVFAPFLALLISNTCKFQTLTQLIWSLARLFCFHN